MNLPNTYLSILKDKGFEVVEGKGDDKLWGTAYTFRKGNFSCCIDSGTNFEDFMSFLDNKISDVDTLYEENLCQHAEEYAAAYQELVMLTEMYYEKIHLLKKKIQSRAGD